MNYWADKPRLIKRAKEHTKTMADKFEKTIDECSRQSSIYSHNSQYQQNFYQTKIELIESTSLDAIFEQKDKNVCVLNFASYKEPGGRFMDGSSAQEESLCHASCLYNILITFPAYYEWNNMNLNKALYTNRAIYTPGVPFFKDDETTIASVLTCASPNKKTAQKYCNVSNELNLQAMQERIDFMLSIAATHNPEVLILGAFGCGAFGQDANEVAKIFETALYGKYKNQFQHIIFAIPDKNGDNYKAFAAHFCSTMS